MPTHPRCLLLALIVASAGCGGGGGGGGKVVPPAEPPPAGQDAGPPAADAAPVPPTETPPPVGPPPSTPDAGTPPSAPPPPAGPDDLPACKRTVAVPNGGALAAAINDAMPGDCLELADGDYQFPVITKQGTAEAPIVIRAKNLLGAVISMGSLKLQASAYVVVQGLMYKSNTPASVNDCDHCRVSRCRFQLVDGSFDTLTVGGKSTWVRVDHNDFGPKTVLGNTLMLAGSGAQAIQNTRVDHNYFHDVSGGGGNGWETIRGGLSGWSFSSAKTTIEWNLFERCTGDPETISMKSSDNILRYNTLRDNKGELTLRHGNGTQVYGNYLLSGTGGIRVCGGKHKIFNNYIADVSEHAIFLEGGEHDDMSGALTDHKQVYDTQVLFNTIVNSRGIDVGGSHPMNPKNCTVANNLLQGPAMLNEVAGTVNTTYAGNIVNGAASVTMGIKTADPKLTKVGEVFRIAEGSPAIDAADPMFTVMDDIDGNARSGKLDVGAQELTAGGMPRGPLTPKDVGPMSP